MTKSVLWIEDDAYVIRGLFHYLLALDLDVSVAETAEDAVTALQTNSYDLVIFDLIMPYSNSSDSTAFNVLRHSEIEDDLYHPGLMVLKWALKVLHLNIPIIILSVVPNPIERFNLKSFENISQVNKQGLRPSEFTLKVAGALAKKGKTSIHKAMFQDVENSKINVFLCHSSLDKQAVRKLRQKLTDDGFDPWLDEEKLLPGQDWDLEIIKAVKTSDVIVICLSKKSITKAGYVQREIKLALDVAEKQPEGAIFLIPAKIEECDVPERLSRWQWVNLVDDTGYKKLKESLLLRAKSLNNLKSE